MTASYLQNNDYTPLQMRRPYQLPTNDIAQTVATLDGYWKQGAARVKAQYENVAGLNLTLQSNQDYAKDYLKQAQEQMKKLSTKDLSSRDVQMEGINLFKPILENENIKLDHTIGNLRQSVIAEAQSYKTKGKGEGYADENLVDALNNFEGFGKDTDPNNLKSIYEKVKNARYVPYYDVQKEMITLRDKCGEVSGMELDKGGLGYDVSTTGTPTEKLRSCLEFLSPQANTQISITARVRYNKDYRALGNDLLLTNEKLAASYAKQEAELQGVIDAKKLGNRDLTSEEIISLTNLKSTLKQRLTNIIEQNAKIKAGDFSEIQQNYTDYAGQVYKNKLIDGFANSFYTEEKEMDVNFFKKMELAHQYALQQIDYKAKRDKEAKDEELGVPFGEGDRIISGDQGKEVAGKTYDRIKTETDNLGTQMGQTLSSFFSHIQSITGDNGNPLLNKLKKSLTFADINRDNKIEGDEVTKAYSYLQSYYEQAKADENQLALEQIKDVFNSLSTMSSQIKLNQDILKVVDAQVNKEVNPKAFYFDGKKISNDEYQQIKSGNHPIYYITPYKNESLFGGSLLSASQGINVNTNTITGKGFEIRRKDNNKVVLTPIQYDKSIFNYDEKVNKKREELLTKELANQYSMFNTNDSRESQQLKKNLIVAAGLSSNMESKDINTHVNLFPSFGDGTVRFQFVGLKSEEITKVNEQIQSVGGRVLGGVWKEIDPEKGIYEITNQQSFDKLSRFGDVSSLNLMISVSDKLQKPSTLRQMIGIANNSPMVSMEYNPDSKQIYIKSNGLFLQSYSSSNIIDAINKFNSLTQ